MEAIKINQLASHGFHLQTPICLLLEVKVLFEANLSSIYVQMRGRQGLENGLTSRPLGMGIEAIWTFGSVPFRRATAGQTDLILLSLVLLILLLLLLSVLLGLELRTALIIFILKQRNKLKIFPLNIIVFVVF